jgi:hypothetical protein
VEGERERLRPRVDGAVGGESIRLGRLVGGGRFAQGKTNSDIRTVQHHLEHVFQKLGVETRTAAVAEATRRA